MALLLLGSLACAARRAPINYAEYVWPPPPDTPRIQLTEILRGRFDLQPRSWLGRALVGATPRNPYDWLRKPFAVEFDAQGRVLVTDPTLGAIFRFDSKARHVDVFGTTGAQRLKQPLGLGIGPDGTIFVADVGLRKVLAFDADGQRVRAAYGRRGELVNPTDAAVSLDGTRLYVSDSKAQKIVVFDVKTSEVVSAFGQRGEQEGEFNFPSSVTLDRSGNLFVIDQINARLEILSAEGEYLDQLGGLGVGVGRFVRPKDVAVDDAGLIYVTDAAFNNVQIFDADLQPLTFVGEGGTGPGRFQLASGVACHGDEFAVVDQLGARVQVFRFLVPKTTR